MAEYMSDKAITENLKDAGCDDAVVKEFLELGNAQNRDAQMRLLSRHRCTLLDLVHLNQKRIDCLDYLIHRMK